MARRRASRTVRKTIFDPVHGTIALEGMALTLVSTPTFQRLWGIRQTGFAHLVFPGANHTRLEHSLGAYWVASQIAERLGLDPAERDLVGAAALLHDIGHGPFSHTLDAPMLEVLGYGHETVSRRLILGTSGGETPRVAETLERYGLAPRAVADLVDPPARGRGASVLREVLHGAVDADRLDYLQRDAHYTGVAHGAIDSVRILETLRTERGRLVFAEKGRSAVEGFLVGRALMYSSVYYHKTVRAAEMMAQAALERHPRYLEIAPSAFGWTDGEWLVRMKEAGGVSAALVRGIARRLLWKRAHGLRDVRGGRRSGWGRLLNRPGERRALEDELAARAKAPPGSVIVDLAGLAPRGDPGKDWGEIGLVADGRTTYPFRRPSVWLLLATRPPSDWAVSVYAAPAVRDAVERVVSRDPSALP